MKKSFIHSQLLTIRKSILVFDFLCVLFFISCNKGKEPLRQVPAGGVDLGLSVVWHQCNIGANSPEEAGYFFGFGDTIGQTWDGSQWSGKGFHDYRRYETGSRDILKLEYDAAHVCLGSSWRMPTESEWNELVNNCTIEPKIINGVSGRLYTSKKPGYTNASIFMPTPGHGYGENFFPDEDGYLSGHWSSTKSKNSGSAWCHEFGWLIEGSCQRSVMNGYNIRAVSEY